MRKTDNWNLISHVSFLTCLTVISVRVITEYQSKVKYIGTWHLHSVLHSLLVTRYSVLVTRYFRGDECSRSNRREPGMIAVGIWISASSCTSPAWICHLHPLGRQLRRHSSSASICGRARRCWRSAAERALRWFALARYNLARIDGLDLLPTMLQVARRRLRLAGLGARTRALPGEAGRSISSSMGLMTAFTPVGAWHARRRGRACAAHRDISRAGAGRTLHCK